jgi:hypothetical protein
MTRVVCITVSMAGVGAPSGLVRGLPAPTEKNQLPPRKVHLGAGAAKGRCVPVLAGLDLLSFAVNGPILHGAIGCHMDWTRAAAPQPGPWICPGLHEYRCWLCKNPDVWFHLALLSVLIIDSSLIALHCIG